MLYEIRHKRKDQEEWSAFNDSVVEAESLHQAMDHHIERRYFTRENYKLKRISPNRIEITLFTNQPYDYKVLPHGSWD